MTERGLPIVDGAPACPFVAFDDDRDERATSPDHRHRCFAESPPAPRALAHQEAYCLSSAFPVCPTFQDWARREAARARPRDVAPGDEDEGDLPPLAADRPPRRQGPGTWAAPPPWLRGGGAAAAGASGIAASGMAPAGSGPGGPAPEPATTHGAPPASPGSSPSLAGPAGHAGTAGGLAGSFADRMASHDDALTPEPDVSEPAWAGHDAWDDEIPAPASPAPATAAAAAMALAGASAMTMPADPSGPSIEAMAPRRREHERSDAGRERDEDGRERDVRAPSWERPRRLEAYPTLKSRRLPAMALPPLLIGAAAVLLAAAALFFLPSLLGLGGGGPGGGASPTPSGAASVAPNISAVPTAVAEATPQIYLVQAGDTMSKIANKFHVPLATLIGANQDTIPNPDVLKIGDPVIIPSATPTELPGASTTP
jgi:LysM repeat protein